MTKMQSSTLNVDIPKKIWLFWDHGLEHSQNLIRFCHATWVRLNPDWEVIFLDNQSIAHYIDFPNEFGSYFADLPVQKQTNLYRLCLLSKYGGVWADATCLCSRPLNDWLPQFAQSGFFAFRNPGKDRLLANWFLASSENCPLIRSFYQEHKRFWQEHTFSHKKTRLRKIVTKTLCKLLSRNTTTTDLWLSWLITRGLRIYPYFVFHYHFAYHLRRHPEFHDAFFEMPYYDAQHPLRVIRGLRAEQSLDSIRNTVHSEDAPVHKLSYKIKSLRGTDKRLRARLKTIFPEQHFDELVIPQAHESLR